MTGKITDNTMKIVAPVDGIISDIMVSNGGYVETGLPVVRITNSNDLLIEAFVNQSDHKNVSGIFDANFKDPSGSKDISHYHHLMERSDQQVLLLMIILSGYQSILQSGTMEI